MSVHPPGTPPYQGGAQKPVHPSILQKGGARAPVQPPLATGLYMLSSARLPVYLMISGINPTLVVCYDTVIIANEVYTKKDNWNILLLNFP